jgi:hypothetical protein
MPDLTGTVSRTHTAPLTLTSLSETFKDVGEQQHLRFSQAKGLHTHSRFGPSMTDFLAFFRNSDALRARAELRQNGANQIKQAIDNEYGPGMGDRVFAQLGLDPARGVTKRDLDNMNRVANQFREQDIAAAQQRLGVEGMDEMFANARDELGIDLELPPHQVADLRGKVANAVLSLPHGATKAECERAAMGEIVKFDLMQMVNNSGHPYNNTFAREFEELMNACFRPGGDHLDAEPATVHSLMAPYCGRGGLPTASEFAMQLVRLEAVGQPIEARAQMIYDFVQENALGSDGEGIAKHELEAFMRSNPNKAEEPGVGAYAVMRDVGNQAFGESTARIVNLFRDIGNFEVRKDKLKGTPELQLQTAQRSLDVFNQAMKELFGGTTDEEIAKAVAKLPQEFCDLLATAHAAVETGGYVMSEDEKSGLSETQLRERQAQLQSEAKQQMHDSLDVNFVALRAVNPLLVEMTVTNPSLNKNVVMFTKLMQDSANGVVPGTKEPLHPGIRDDMIRSVAQWGEAYDKFMALARARGTNLVG